MLYNLQSGFRKSHSTETALIRLIDQLLFERDSNKVSGLAFIDYKKEFDLIDHKILLAKLCSYDISERDMKLLTSYLYGSSQVCQY